MDDSRYRGPEPRRHGRIQEPLPCLGRRKAWAPRTSAKPLLICKPREPLAPAGPRWLPLAELRRAPCAAECRRRTPGTREAASRSAEPALG